MTRQAIRIPVVACLLILVGSAGALTDEPKPEKQEKPGTPTPDADEEHRREAEQLVGTIELEALVGEKWVKVKRIEKPLLYFGDATRGHTRGSVWGWGETGRPVALLELFRNGNSRTKWISSLCNTSGGKLRATREGKPWWRENESIIDLREVPGAPVPAGEAATRQRQLKQLAGKFTGHEFWDPNNSRYELRRLDRPLHTYRDEAKDVQEGALYVLANGTNPEIALFVEARTNPKDKSKTGWHFFVGRMSHAEFHLEYDGKEVLSGPRGRALSGTDKPYWVSDIITTPPPEPKK